MTNQFIIKTFMKKKAVKILLYYPDKSYKTYYAIPEGDIVRVDNKRFKINNEDFALDNKKMATYTFDINNVEPKAIYNENCLNKVMSPKDFDIAISSNVSKQIFEVTSGNVDKATISLILSVITLGAVLVAIYLIINKFDSVIELINQVKKVTDLMGGIG